MSGTSPTDILRAALAALPPWSAVSGNSVLVEPLRAKVCAVVDELKARGTAPEHVVLTVKAIAQDVRPKAADELLVGDLVKWCLNRYFPEA